MNERGRDASTSDEWAEAIAGDLIERLDAVAFEHEKILEKLDIRRAKAARSLSMELSAVRRTLASVPRDLTDGTTRDVINLFRELRVRANALLSGAPLDSDVPVNESGPLVRQPPARVGDDDDLDEITAARTPESLRTSPRRRN